VRYLLFALIVLTLGALPAFGASNYLGGMSGVILTPDAILAPERTWEFSFHDSIGAIRNKDLIAWGANYGVARNVEVGFSLIDSGSRSNLTLNGKYVVVTETEKGPAVAIGVFDLANFAREVNGNASLYMLLSKNVTGIISDFGDVPSHPVYLNLGVGSGVFSGIFGSVDWTWTERLAAMAEYTNGRFGDNHRMINAGIRYAIADEWRLDAATLSFKHLAVGANYRTQF
jgi:hypothetical protein